ncbi:MAG: MoaD/ThiS family protein [Pyrinomonadaceae bacterium]
MMLRILFFGATADIAGKRRIDIEVPPETTTGDVFNKLIAEYPKLASHKLHISLNQQYASGDEILRDGDELALFTAVSGG